MQEIWNKGESMREKENRPIQQIKEKLIEVTEKEKKTGYTWIWLQSFLEENRKDSRSGVQQLCQKAEKLRNSIESERNRILKMWSFENQYQGKVIAGVDEVGRGPLAGPVVAGMVILDPSKEILFLNDSKKLSDEKRRELAEEIKEKAIAYSLGLVGNERIDQINILQATYEAMTNAWREITVAPEVLLNDAVVIPQIDLPQLAITGGDGKSVSIAAASILAKVARDDIMLAYDSIYPQYQFAKNKGYGTKEHIEAIAKYGVCEIHRMSFVKNFIS